MTDITEIMRTKHTPGPWLREGNTIYALMHDCWRKGVEQFRNRFFAQVQVDVSCSDEEREANARLIAAAPDLLEALECLLIGACAVGVPHAGERAVLQDAVNIARAAIAKAIGQKGGDA